MFAQVWQESGLQSVIPIKKLKKPHALFQFYTLAMPWCLVTIDGSNTTIFNSRRNRHI
jgi:hypothetical protein